MTVQSSPRYWVIAPFQAADPKQFDEVWQSDLEHGVISIGWQDLGDISSHSKEQLKVALAGKEKPGAVGLIANMLWNFYHEIKVGDTVIARKGRKTIAAVGTVVRSAYYDAEKTDHGHRNFIDVCWRPTLRDKML